MLRFRKILLSNSLYFIILSLVLILGFFRLTRPLKEANLEKTFTVTKIKLDGNYLELLLENEAQVLAQKYFKTEAEKNEFKINLGDQVKIKGSPKEIRNSGLPSSFDYQKYLKTQKISKVIKLEELELIESNKNILYQFKQDIIDYINGRKNATYLQIFILADSSTLEKDINLAYQEIAINHLLSISGTHVSFIAMIFLKVFKVFKIDELKSYLWITICLLALGFIASFPPAFLGSAVFFLYLSLNKIFYFNVKRINLFILAFSTLLLLNPSFIFHLGFQYHYLISFFLILSSDILNKHQNYFVSLFVTSLIAFLASLPLSLKINSYINPLSVLYNLVYVPYVVSCLFPLLIINLFLPFTDNLVSFLCFILEHLSSFLASFSTYLIFKKINNFFYLFYYLILLLSLKRKKLIYLFLIILTFHYSLSFRRDDYIMFLDVGQGDSTLISYNKKYYLIDAGGTLVFKRENWSQRKKEFEFGRDALVPALRSLGITTIDTLFITHGDVDHIGGAFAVVDKLKVKRIIFNKNDFNDLELSLIKQADKKKIPYQKIEQDFLLKDQSLSIKDYSFDHPDENSSSLILLLKLVDKTFLLMGDAGHNEERKILQYEELKEVKYLKLGHHGSKHSSSKEFINFIDPKIALISVGANNRYGHPNEAVLENLKDYKIYRTDQDGSIKIKLK